MSERPPIPVAMARYMLRLLAIYAAVALVGGLLFIIAALVASALAQPVERVCRVIDGDTIVMCTGEVIRLRLVDAPEMAARCGFEGDLARQARAFAAASVHGGIILRRQGLDRFGRTLADVHMPDGTDLGAELVARGLARVWRNRREPWCP